MPAFPGLTTERLTIRSMTLDDVESLWQRRNDADAATYQNWTLPFPRERAEQMCASFASVDGPASDSWWMAAVCDRTTDEVVGDLAVHLTFDERVAEIGYTFARSTWGNGFATEAAEALADWLVDEVGVSRVSGMTHPENLASVVVLERIGMRFEGHTRNSYWVGDENSDDWIFGMTADERVAWRERSRDAPAEVALVEITPANLTRVEKLATHRSQQHLVATMAGSFADALFPAPHEGRAVTPWLRAIEADGTIAGFVMTTTPTDDHPEVYLWRLLVDRFHQRRGIGVRAVDLVIEQARAWGSERVEVSYVEGPGSPEPLYRKAGFVPTGNIVDGETEAALTL